MDKGISPLVATVLLVAFTIAIAAMSIGFYASFAREQTVSTSDTGRDVVNCGSASLRIIPSRTTWNGTHLTVNVENTGSAPLRIPEMIIYNTGDVAEVVEGPVPASGYGGAALNTSSNELPAGGFVTFRESISYHPERVTVRTNCPERTSTAENDTSDGTTDFDLAFN